MSRLPEQIPASQRVPSSAFVDYLQSERRWNFFRRLGANRNAFLLLSGTAGVSLLLAVRELVLKSSAKEEVARRKRQLQQPVVELKGNDAIEFPWTQPGQKVGDWLHRPVKITGRPVHSRAMCVPRTVDGYEGYDYIVPLITKENEDGSEEYGILLNKGWIPHEYKSPARRFKIENVLPQTFVGYVSKNTELNDHPLFKGNTPDREGTKQWTHVYLPDMARATGFKNVKNARAALIECVDLETPLDETNPSHYDREMTGSKDYPFKKTRAGALQTEKMPWTCERDFNRYLTVSMISGAIALLAKAV